MVSSPKELSELNGLVSTSLYESGIRLPSTTVTAICLSSRALTQPTIWSIDPEERPDSV